MDDAASPTRETDYTSDDVVRYSLVLSVSTKLDDKEKRFRVVAGQRVYLHGPCLADRPGWEGLIVELLNFEGLIFCCVKAVNTNHLELP